MKDTINLWAGLNTRLPGVHACCVLYPDKTTFAQSWSPEYTREGLENAWRCVADTFQVLQLHRLPGVWIRWVFAHAYLYTTRRADGVCFALITAKDPPLFEADRIETLLSDFHQLQMEPGAGAG